MGRGISYNGSPVSWMDIAVATSRVTHTNAGFCVKMFQDQSYTNNRLSWIVQRLLQGYSKFNKRPYTFNQKIFAMGHNAAILSRDVCRQLKNVNLLTTRFRDHVYVQLNKRQSANVRTKLISDSTELTHRGHVMHIGVSYQGHHCQTGDKPLSEPMLAICHLNTWDFSEIWIKIFMPEITF